MLIPNFSGPVIRPDEAGYDAARAVWNAMHDRRPALIARPSSAADVAAAILYLASDEAEFVTGVALPVDGGYTAA